MSCKKRKFVTLHNKLKIIEENEKGCRVSALAAKHGVAKSTICGIIKMKGKIVKAVNLMLNPSKKCTLKEPEFPRMEAKLHKWFCEQRSNHMVVSGEMIKHKAKELHKQLSENSSQFHASDGWMQRFKRRYGIRYLKVVGEKLSSRQDLVDPFITKLAEKMEELNLTKSQIYNADETALFWQLLPNRTYVSMNEKTAPGMKTAKQRITVLACTNGTGSHKVNLLVIGKARNPRCFKNFDIPVIYKSSKNAWMTREIFKNWFFDHFVPEVRAFLGSQKFPQKALLLLDNAPCHPLDSVLVTDDGKITVMFLPPNVTPLIQPMDQNVIRLLKLHYRNSLLNTIVAQKDDLAHCLKRLNLKEAIINLNVAWNKLDPVVISKCWTKIFQEEHSDEEDNIPLALLRETLQGDSRNVMQETIQLLNEINREHYSILDIANWNNDDRQEVTEADASTESSTSESCEEIKIPHTEAIKSVNVLIEWAEQNNLSVSMISNLKQVQEVAVQKNISLKKVQTTLTKYFQTQ